MSRITWEQGRYAVQRGVAGKLELFSLTPSTQRGSSEWQLRTLLPGIIRDHTAESEEAGKAKAEALLATWLRLTDNKTPEAPEASEFEEIRAAREDQLRQLLSDLRESYPDAAQYSMPATFIDRLAAILDGES